MTIQAIGHMPGFLQAAAILKAGSHPAKLEPSGEVQGTLSEVGQTVPEETTGDLQTEPVAPVSEDSENVPGVIRNLEAGHFKGVADVRLRINFFDELSARAEAAAVPVIQEQAESLITTITDEIGQLAGALETDEETGVALDTLVDQFNEAVQSAVEQTAAEISVDASALETTLQAAFDDLVSAVTELFNAAGDEKIAPLDTDVNETTEENQETAPAESPVEPTGDESLPEDEPALTLEDAIASLSELFQESLTSLIASINEATQLPDPSEPRGNGGAYDKFLAIYNELRGQTVAIDESA